MATRSLNVVISGDSKQLGVATRKAEGHLDDLQKRGAKAGKALALGFAAAGAAAGTALVVGLKKSVDAAKDAEVSQARLQAQLKASGISYRAHAREIESVIQKHSQLAGLDDEELQDAFTNIVRVTGNVDKSMRLVGLAADFARAKHMDVAKAGELVGKVAGGNTGILARYGIQIEKGATATQALGELHKRFAGQAEAYGKTAAGAQDRFGVAVENLQEKLGAKLLPVIANITNKVATFVGQMESGKGAGGRFANAVSDGFNRAKEVVERAVTAIRGFLDRNRDDIRSVINAFKTVARIAKDVFQDTMLPIIRRTIKAIGEQIEGLVHVIRGIVRVVSGLLSGDWKKAWDGAKEVVRGAFKIIKTAIINNLENILEVIKDLGPKIVKGIGRGLINMDKAILTGILHGLQAAAKALPGVAGAALRGIGKAITSGISKGFGAVNPFGDGLGKPSGSAPSNLGLSGGNTLMGADSDLGWIASAAGRFGLHTSSGLRPGSITSSGNVSFHSSGDAVDEAGSASGMLGFFRYMKSKFGGTLRELIHTPGGVGIKDGKPFRYTGQVAADHYDHVHVAFTGGAQGDGIGDGTGDYTQMVAGWRNGPKGAMSHNQVAAVAESVGLPGETFAQIARGESGYDPDNIGHDPGGTTGLGLWQITTKFNDDIIRRHGGPKAMLDPRANALAARDIWRSQGKGAWYGTRYVTGWNLHYKGSLGGVSKSGGSGGSTTSTQSAAPKFVPGSGTASHTGSNTASGVGSVTASKGSSGVGPIAAGRTYAGALDDLGLAKAQANDDPKKLVPIVFGEMVLKRRRLDKIKKALKKRLSKETRSRLVQEATQLVEDLNALSELMYELTGGKGGKAPAGADAAGGADGGSGGTAGGDGGTADPGPTELDYLDLGLANAEATEDTADDVTALTALRDYRQRALDAAIATGDPRLIAQARRDLTSVDNQLKDLTEALKANTAALEEQRQAFETLIAQDYQRQFNVSQSQYGVLAQAIAEVANGGIGQRLGLSLSGLRAAPGAVART